MKWIRGLVAGAAVLLLAAGGVYLGLLYFNNYKVEQLREKIGEEIAVGDWYPVTQEQINLFAEATGDYQWIHLDEKRAAKESPFGTTIAHGFLTLSLLPRIMGDTVELPPAKMMVNYGLNRVVKSPPVLQKICSGCILPEHGQRSRVFCFKQRVCRWPGLLGHRQTSVM
ncbi:MAG: MaoC family dehydratase [Desulfosalsimonas sp.]|uniref:MaoC family dehydratase n=1 Tax=Desulfosalsimonas sp. TaxID=3073848 RepID=UPI00397110FE